MLRHYADKATGWLATRYAIIDAITLATIERYSAMALAYAALLTRSAAA